MRIGIDIDNVISDFDNALLRAYLKHDKEIHGKGIVNPQADHIRKGMFDWSEEEESTFYYNNIEEIATHLKPIHKAPEIITQLKEEGNEIYIISGRDNQEYTKPFEMTKAWLEKYHIPYDELLLTNAYDKQAKTRVCLAKEIAIMIEDSTGTCKDLMENGITVWMMNTRFNQNDLPVERVSSWEEIQKKMKKLSPKKVMGKIPVILDTDTYNEVDDQFALAYLLQSQDRFQIEAITIAPYQHHGDLTVEEGIEKSYQEVLKIADWLNFDTKDKVWKGSTDYRQEGYDEDNEAVNQIIKIALKNEKTYLLAIGAITNVALALQKAPEIKDKIEVIWLGGNSLLSKNNQEEYNFRQDVQAVREVFQSEVKLTIIPTKNVASNLKTTIYEIEHHLKNKSELGNYLCEHFYQDATHGIQTRRVIWDISVIAYMIHPEWFETMEIPCPTIKEDTSYELNPNCHRITMVNYLNADNIYEDLFQKLNNQKIDEKG